MSLIFVTKMSEKECTSACVKLDLNAFQFAKEIHQPHIIFFICGLCANPNGIYFAANEAKWHQGLEN